MNRIRNIAESNPEYARVEDSIIWEIGANHMGDVDRTKAMMLRISEQSPKARVKLQYFDPNKLTSPKAVFVDGRNQRSVLWQAALTWDEMIDLVQYARKIGLRPGVTFFDKDDAAAALRQDVPLDFFKVASPDAIDTELLYVYLRDVQKRDLFISTGGMSFTEVDNLFKFLREARMWRETRSQEITVMHCMSQYPAPHFGFHEWALIDHSVNESNTLVKPPLCNPFHVGYSDHSSDTSNMRVALELGAETIERHVYFDVTEDIDVDCATSVDDIQQTIAELAEWMSSRRADRQSIVYTRRYWCSNFDIKAGDPLSGQALSLRRCMRPHLEENARDMFSSSTPQHKITQYTAFCDIPANTPIEACMIKELH